MGFTYAQCLLRKGLSIVVPLAFAACLPLASLALPRDAAEQQKPISWDAASADFDYPNKTGDFKGIVVTQGATRIQADRAHATGLDEKGFNDGRWTFQGNVRIDAEPRGTLRSDEAVVEVRDQRIATATATGRPAEFQQRHGKTGELTRGHADLIVYDVEAGTVRLTKEAWLSNGRDEITGPMVVYNIKQQRWIADSGKGAKPGDTRVHMTINPQGSQPAPGKSDPARKPQSP
jgi:lipopolysaccharide export system protein LptA